MNLVRTLSEQGVAIIISHQLYDVFQVAHRLVVLRRGEKVIERLAKKTNSDEIVSLMVGAELVQEARGKG